MPGLIRGVARTAAIAGTATAVSNRVSRRQGQRWAAKEEQQYAQQQQYAPPPQEQYAPPAAEPAAAPITEDRIEALKQLAALKDQGILTEAEFAAEKAKILGA